MTAYTKYEVGNKLFVIEWLLSVDNSEDQGDFFEARDCELLSISSFIDIVSGSPVAKLYHTNQSNAPATPGVASAYVSNLSDAGPSILIPWPSLSAAVLPPPTRYIAPRLEGGSSEASCRVACLFKDL